LLPAEHGEIYSGYTGVPKFYLQAETIMPSNEEKSREMEGLEVSLAVSFEGLVDDKPGIYATYVTHDPGRRGSFDEAIDWMQDHYVSSYSGKILTDFDEQENHFSGAVFSLQKVMKFGLKKSDFQIVQTYIGNVENLLAVQSSIKNERNYIVTGGNVGALGDNARAENFVQGSESRRSSKRKSIRDKE
jgi:hypothetical protein